MLVIIALLASLILSGPTFAAAPVANEAAPAAAITADNSFQIGVHFGDVPFSGISVKKRVSSGLIMEGIANLNESYATGGARLLFDLGKRGNVFRYMGVGVAGGVFGYNQSYPTTLSGIQGFIGIDYPTLGVFSFSTEIMIQMIKTDSVTETRYSPKTGINWGWNYWF